MGKDFKKNNSLKINIIINTFYQILTMVIPLVTAPYISRVLKGDGIGVYSYTLSLVTYFTMFAALGTGTYGMRTIARVRDKKDDYSKKFWEIELLTIITSIFMLLIWICFAFFYIEYRRFMFILSFNILAVLFDISWFYAGLEKFKYTIIVNVFFKILSLIAVFLFIKTHDDLWKYILINSISLVGGNISMWLFLPKVLCKAKIDINQLKFHLKETFVYFLPTIATTIYTVLDKTLIGLLISGETTIIENGDTVVKKISELENGYYEQATKILMIVKAVSFLSINGVMESRSSYLFGKEDHDGAKKLLLMDLSITTFLSVGAVFGLAAVASLFVPIFFGDGYEKTITLCYVLTGISLIICISNCLATTYYTPSGRRKQSTRYIIIGAITNLVLNIPLIILFKSIGAAIASVISELLVMILYVIKSNGFITFKQIFHFVWKKIIAGIIMLAIILILNHFSMSYINHYLLLLTDVLLGFVIYMSILIVLRDDSITQFLIFLKDRVKKEKHNE